MKSARAYEERLAKIEKILYKHGLSDPEPSESESRSSSGSSHYSYDSEGDSDRSDLYQTFKKAPKNKTSRPKKLQDRTQSGHTEKSSVDYRKMPEILPEFTSEDDDPETFVTDFNSILECLNEEPSFKTTFWFKIRVKVLGSCWDAGLDPKKHSLHRYQKFLNYFWSESMQ